MTMLRFLRKHTGIDLLNECLSLPDEVDPKDNAYKKTDPNYLFEEMSSYLKELSENPNKLDKIFELVNGGLDNMIKKDVDSPNLKELLIDFVNNNAKTCAPDELRPISDPKLKKLTRLVNKALLYTGDKSPCVKAFPGDFKTAPELLQNVNVSIHAEFAEWVSTGYYLPAGVTFSLHVNSGNLDGWFIRIGSHSDDIGECDTYKRYPVVSLVKYLKSSMSFSSAFGGLIYFESSSPGNLEVTLNNVVEAPVFAITKPETISNWENRRNAPGLW